MTEHVFRSNGYERSCQAKVTGVNGQGIELDRTVFYPNGGGQPGDTGILRFPDGRQITITNTLKGDAPDSIVHVASEGSDMPSPGSELLAEIDWERRHRHMRMHTCLHLLSALVPYPVTGGSVGDGKGRLDFDVSGEMLDKEQLNLKLNELIARKADVAARWVAAEELLNNPELVKTMSVKPPISVTGQVRLIEVKGLDRPIDLQACGGTHVANTGEIGAVIIRKIESKGRQNRRIILEFN